MPRRVLDYPSTLAGWHSLATSGHLITVISVIFFILMLFDSFYEGRSAVSRTQGVSRLNNRLAFFAYEQRKLRHVQARALVLRRGCTSLSVLPLYSFLSCSEQVAWEYTFRAN
jgi:heme/copper-type cytochrome/quinol oxidase subunit 1